MRFGSQTVLEITEAGVLMASEEKYHDFRTVKRITRYTESVKVKDHNAALTEFLKLLDRYKAGEILDFGIECIATSGNLTRVEKTWVVQDLR